MVKVLDEKVALLVSAWIETWKEFLSYRVLEVALLVSAWIETVKIRSVRFL